MPDEFFKLLKKDHEKVKKILDQLNETTPRAARKRDELFIQLKDELVPHMEAEENIYYPALLDVKEARKKALESVEEHHIAKNVLAELENTQKDSDVWSAKIQVFKELVEHHIKEEESAVFSLTKDYLDKQTIKNLAITFQEAKERIRMRM